MKQFFVGRMNRSTYLIVVLVGVLAAVVLRMPSIEESLKTNELSGALIALFIVTPLLIWQFAASARRFHDMGYSGWYALVIIIPGSQLVLAVFPGNKAKNKYGPVHEQTYDLGSILYSQTESPTATD